MATQDPASYDAEDIDWSEGSGNYDDDDAEWLDLEPGQHVVGELRDVKENCGKNNSRVYKLARGIGDLVLLWGNNSLDRRFDDEDFSKGDVIAIRCTTETYTNDHGEFPIWQVGRP